MKTSQYLLNKPMFAYCAAALAVMSARGDEPGSGTYESPGPVDAASFIAPVPLQGPGYSVYPQGYNDGLMNRYQITLSSGAKLEVLGTEALLERIVEAAAIEDLRRVSSSENFGKALGKAGGDKLKAAGSAIMNPLKTLGSVPKGASRFFGKIGEGLKGGASEYEDKAYADLAGAAQAKRQLAAKYGVNPYSTNPELQDELNKVAWVQAGVGGAINIGLSAATGGAAGLAVTAVNANTRMYNRVRDEDPANLRIENRKKLLELGLTREQTEPLLKHPAFSPMHETIICDALAALGRNVNVAGFIQTATIAQAEEDAFFFQRSAQLMKLYHQTEAPIVRLVPSRLIMLCEDAQGRVFLPVPLDFAIWFPRIAGRMEELGPQLAGKQLVIWTTGQMSQRLQQEFQARKIAFKTGVKPTAE
jgi:hypothetical protein